MSLNHNPIVMMRIILKTIKHVQSRPGVRAPKGSVVNFTAYQNVIELI